MEPHLMAHTKKIIVTGGSGKAGVATLMHLAEHGYEILNLDTAPLLAEIKGVRSLKVDLTDYGQTVDAMKGYRAVIHLAAIPRPGLVTDQLTFDINTRSTFNVFQAATLLGMRRVVWASSETVLGLPFDVVKPKQAPIDESHAPYPASTYSLSKVLGEEMARHFNQWSGIAYVGLRLSNVINPEEYARFEDFQDKPLVRKWNLWGYVDARDVGLACRCALEADITGAETFIIAAEDTVMRTSNAELLAEVFPECQLMPETAPNATLLSIEKARRMLGYKPRHSWRNDR